MAMKTTLPAAEPSLIIRVSEAARLLGVSESTVWAWSSENSPRHIEEFPRIFPLHSRPNGKGASGIFRKHLDEFLAVQWAKAVEKDANRTSTKLLNKPNSGRFE
ncbi:helix-turn-helix transcriptional regulator [Acidithiobacillus ferriphilus]|uniref:helix-turn-helix transcriptional regulator n=1 Tax=Acidithiobacillus ferriphilus TaxID=1689834 RepID=UPI0023144C24|nr:helix-turn-helix domain-containing protein [Acidithiobacillus ferriphilus]MDA8154043.1 helix-turn-helix domain containing protein [Acidithiobacillus sp.]MEB8537233.1 helix-turn-helix domain containing protein [Acidithiobacillus ferriphilus]